MYAEALVLLESHNYNFVISPISLLFSPGTVLNVIKWFTCSGFIRWFALVLVSLLLFRHFIVSHNLHRCFEEIYDFVWSIEIQRNTLQELCDQWQLKSMLAMFSLFSSSLKLWQRKVGNVGMFHMDRSEDWLVLLASVYHTHSSHQLL